MRVVRVRGLMFVEVNDGISALFWLFACVFAVGLAAGLLTGCGATARDTAITSVNFAKEVEVTAGAELEDRCTKKLEHAPPPPVETIAAKCGPARAAYGVLRAARLATLAALVKSGADPELVQRAAELANATAAAVKAGKDLP